MRKKRALLYFYNRQNLGDDLLVLSITKRYPNVCFSTWVTGNEKQNLPDTDILKLIKDSKIFKLLRNINPALSARYSNFIEKQNSAVIYIGGSLFIEYENWQDILNWWEYEAENQDFYVIGANFGPFVSEAYRDRCASIFSQMRDICFRDQYSYRLFDQIKTVRFAPDILFGTDMPERQDFTKRVFISVINCSKKDEGYNVLGEFQSQNIDYIVSLVRQAVSLGYEVTLGAFCTKEGDMDAVNEVVGIVNDSERIRVCSYDGTNSDIMLQAISDSDFVIASRFHAAVLGFAAGKPVLPVIYSDKTKHVLEDAGFSGVSVDLRKLVSVNLDELIKHADDQKLCNIEELRQASLGHFQKLDKVFTK